MPVPLRHRATCPEGPAPNARPARPAPGTDSHGRMDLPNDCLTAKWLMLGYADAAPARSTYSPQGRVADGVVWCARNQTNPSSRPKSIS